MICLEQIAYQYQGRKDKQLKDIDLCVKDGEFLLITGRSGCGKTTLSECINGLIPHFREGALSGKAQINGKNIKEEICGKQEVCGKKGAGRKKKACVEEETSGKQETCGKEKTHSLEEDPFLEVRNLSFAYKNKRKTKGYPLGISSCAKEEKKGMTAADVGCGMGYFTVPMLEMVGEKGKVVAFDLQQQMLTATLNSAKKKYLESKLYLNQCRETSLVIDCWENKLDFVLLFAMAHEAGNRDNLFRELSWAMKPGAKLLMAEPAKHVSKECFDESVEIAQKYGLVIVERPKIKCSQAVVFQKNEMETMCRRKTATYGQARRVSPCTSRECDSNNKKLLTKSTRVSIIRIDTCVVFV